MLKYIVVGCGRLGAELAYRLFQKGHMVTVIDQVSSAFERLPSDFLGRTVEGEALNQTVLHRAGIEQADGLAAVTNLDTINAVIAHIARSHYQVPVVVARNFNPQWRPLYEAFNLQVVSSTSWGAQRLEEMLYHGEMRTVFSSGNGEVEIYEFTVPEPWAGHKLGKLLPTQNCTPASLTRMGKAFIPNRETELQDGDYILVSATFDGVEAVRQSLQQIPSLVSPVKED
jgi:trk system potassium uptake protein TrkA